MSIRMGSGAEPEEGGGRVQEQQWSGSRTAGKSNSNFQGGSGALLVIPQNPLVRERLCHIGY